MPQTTALRAKLNAILQVDTAQGTIKDRILTGEELPTIANCLTFGTGAGKADLDYWERQTFPSGNTDLDLLALATERPPSGSRSFSLVRWMIFRLVSPGAGISLVLGGYGANGWQGPIGTTLECQGLLPIITDHDGYAVDSTRRYLRVNNPTGDDIEADLLILGEGGVPPAQVMGLTATAGVKFITIAWNAIADAMQYNVYTGTSVNSLSLLTSVTDNSYDLTGLTGGTTYYVRVEAANSAGAGELSSEANATPLAAGKVTCIGDSRTAEDGPGVVVPGTSYPDQLATLLGADWTVVNNGVNSRTVEEMVSTFPDEVQGNYDGAKVNELSILAGVNSYGVSGLSPQAIYGSLRCLTALGLSLGFRVNLDTEIAGHGVSPTIPGWDSGDHAILAALIRANSAGADSITDTASDSRLSDDTDTRYYTSDKTHLNATGSGVLAELNAPKIAAAAVGFKGSTGVYLAYDTGVDTNGTKLNEHVPIDSDGNPCGTPWDGPDDFVIEGNVITATTTQYEPIVEDLGNANVVIEVDVNAMFNLAGGNQSNAVVIVRYVDINNYLLAGFGTGAIVLIQKLSGSFQSPIVSAAVAAADGSWHTLKAEIWTTKYRLSADGTIIVPTADMGSIFPTATKHGIARSSSGTPTSQPKWRNLKVRVSGPLA